MCSSAGNWRASRSARVSRISAAARSPATGLSRGGRSARGRADRHTRDRPRRLCDDGARVGTRRPRVRPGRAPAGQLIGEARPTASAAGDPRGPDRSRRTAHAGRRSGRSPRLSNCHSAFQSAAFDGCSAIARSNVACAIASLPGRSCLPGRPAG